MDIKLPGSSQMTSPAKCKQGRLKPAIVDRINFHIAAELNASQMYQAGYAWANYNGMFGTAEDLLEHVGEERKHMNIWYEYLLDKNCMPITPACKQQPFEFKNYKDLITKIFEHEKYVTSIYEEFYAIATKEKDFTTLTKVEWFLAEQIEEEAKYQTILDKLELIEKEGIGVYEIDGDIND